MIEQIYETGDDALAIHFDFDIAPNALFDQENIKFRTTTLSVPSISIGKYDIVYKGQTFSKPNYVDATDKTITFELRLDKYWNVYRKFVSWLYTIKNIKTGANSADKPIGSPSLIRSPAMTIVATDGNAPDPTIYQTWVASQLWPESISEISFDNSGSEPIAVSIVLNYLTLDTQLTA